MAVISQIKATSDNTNYNIRDDYSTWGGRNLLHNTYAPIASTDVTLSRANKLDDEIIRITPTTSAGYATWRVNYLDYEDYQNNYFTFSVDARLADVESTYTNKNIILYICVNLASRWTAVTSGSYDCYAPGVTFTDLTSDWQRFTITKHLPDDFTSGKPSTALIPGSFLTAEVAASGSRVPIDVRRFKLEMSTKPTDWSPAPEDIARFIGDETIELYSE